MAEPKKLGRLFYNRVTLQITPIGYLYASSPTSTGGIEKAVEKNKPSDAQLEARRKLGEQIHPLESIKEEMAQSAEVAAGQAEEAGEVLMPSTVWRRDEQGRPYIHNNYLKGHLRECGDTIAATVGVWHLQDLISRTVFITPARLYIDDEKIKILEIRFTPEVTLKGGARIKQPTIKTSEAIWQPTLNWVLYILGGTKLSRELLNAMLIHGSMRGIGPGRGTSDTPYTKGFVLGEFESVDAADVSGKFLDELLDAQGHTEPAK